MAALCSFERQSRDILVRSHPTAKAPPRMQQQPNSEKAARSNQVATGFASLLTSVLQSEWLHGG